MRKNKKKIQFILHNTNSGNGLSESRGTPASCSLAPGAGWRNHLEPSWAGWNSGLALRFWPKALLLAVSRSSAPLTHSGNKHWHLQMWLFFLKSRGPSSTNATINQTQEWIKAKLSKFNVKTLRSVLKVSLLKTDRAKDS